MMKIVMSFISIILASSLSSTVSAACVTYPANQPDSTIPSLKGKLVYHSYVNYGDGSAKIFIYDFSTKTKTQISKSSWGIQDPMNAVFSPDGKSIAFMGIQSNAWNVYLLDLGQNFPVNLTNSTGQTRNEDPKFTWDGTALIFKRNRDIYRMDLTTKALTNLTKTASSQESSMPYPSVDGKTIYYAVGVGGDSAIYQKNLESGQVSQFGQGPGFGEYYPIVKDSNTVFYTRWLSSTNRMDQIYSKSISGRSPIQLSINDCGSNNSDAAAVGSDHLIFSSTTHGGYQLYLGEISSGKRWSLGQYGINADSSTAKLGADYFEPASSGSGSGSASILLSKNRGVTASSQYSSYYPPKKAVDGLVKSKWRSETSGTEWFAIDLGRSYIIDGIVLNWQAGAKVYSIETSEDNLVWKTIASKASGAGGIESFQGLSASGRYVRLTASQSSTQKSYYGINEIEVWGK